MRSSAFLRDHYIKVKSRRGTKDARCSTARKITESTLYSLERGTLLGGNTQLNLLQETPVALYNVLGIMAPHKG